MKRVILPLNSCVLALKYFPCFRPTPCDIQAQYRDFIIMALTTDWITISTSGSTVDGRNISGNILLEVAENYDTDEYTAMLSADHTLSLYGNYGEVTEVRSNTDQKDRTILQTKIRPNRRLIEMNNQGQRLFTSMELTENFAGTGKAYLMGLAVTDEPSSLGITKLNFTRKKVFV